MLAEIAEGEAVARGRASFSRDDDLAAVGGAGDARHAMDVDPRVVALVDGRPARVEAHPHSKWQRCQCALGSPRGDHSFGRLSEGDEEGVAFTAEDDAPVRLDGIADQSPVLGQQLRIAIAVLTEEHGRALDVREEEGDGPIGEHGAHDIHLRS